MNRLPLRGDDVRIRNEKLILNLIFRMGRASQSQVVQDTGLKAPTVFRIFAKLEAEGFIRQCSDDEVEAEEIASDRKGRRPSYYCVVPSGRYAIGVDFSTIAASVIVVDFANSVIHHASASFSAVLHRDEILDAIESLIHDAVDAVGMAPEALLGIGVASPGVVDTVNGTVVEYARIAGLAGYSIKDHFEERFSVPVFVHNNASVIAASAYHYGVAQNEKSLLAILVRSGVGSALVNHGRLFLNGTATALEIGRTLLCGWSDGRVDAQARTHVPGVEFAPTLESIVAEQPMLSILERAFGVTTWEEAQERVSAADATRELVDARAVLSTAVANLNHIFHPEAILLISRFPLIAQVLGSAAEEAVPGVRVISSVYDPVEACYGATDLVFQSFFGLNELTR